MIAGVIADQWRPALLGEHDEAVLLRQFASAEPLFGVKEVLSRGWYPNAETTSDLSR